MSAVHQGHNGGLANTSGSLGRMIPAPDPLMQANVLGTLNHTAAGNATKERRQIQSLIGRRRDH